LINAPTTKSAQLISAVKELKEITELTQAETEAISEYTKEVKTELGKSLEIAKHEEEKKKQLKEVLMKNEDLITKNDKIIRINANQVLWLDKTEAEIKTINFDKMPPKEKIKYEKLKTELELKTKEMKEMESKVTTTQKKTIKLRIVIMQHADEILSSIKIKSNDMSMVLKEYDEMNGLMNEALNILRRIGMWFANIFKNIFNID
jgi:hypothetical protein